MAKSNYTNDDLTNYYAKIYAEIENETTADPYGNYIYQRVKAGQKTIFNKSQSEIRNFDMSFLDTIESVYPALLKIMRDPKKSIRYENDVVAVEKARKVNSDTVRHLASHTELIKEIAKNGDVIPSKVLTTFAEEELAIYENRFIKSLVKRIELFLERRYEVMKVSLESFETEKMQVTNVFMLSGQEVTIDLGVAIKNDLTADVETTKEQYQRLLQVRQNIQGLKNSEFMRALAKAKDVLPPIMKTNIIIHNPDFKLCYGLWLYLDRVDGIATNVDVKEKNYKFTQIFNKDVNEVMALALTAFIKNRNIDGIYATKKLPQVKAPKPEENQDLELEMNLEADNKTLEDYTMNELLLSQTSEYFEQSLDAIQRTGTKYNESVRVVYRQMLDMLDQIYPKAFGVTDEELESKDLYEQLEYARRRLMVFKIVRQAKQMNIARMGKEEKNIDRIIEKLQEKIKVKEQKDQERLERERQRMEAKRLAELERERKREARKRRLEEAALARQKELERERIEQEYARTSISPEKQAEIDIMKPLMESNREYLKKLREDAIKAEQAQIEAANQDNAPVRRKDEYDDLSDEELEALMKQNDMENQAPEVQAQAEPEVEEKPKKKVVAKKKAEDKASDDKSEEKPKKAQPKKKAKAKVDTSKDLDEMTDEELEALMNQNFEGDMASADMPESTTNDTEEAPIEEVKPEPEVEDKPKKSNVVLKKPEKKKGNPNFGKKKVEDTPTPEAKEEPKVEETPKEMTPEEEQQAQSKAIDDAMSNKHDNISDTDIDDLSDDELDKLMAENGLFDEEESSNAEDISDKLKKKPTISIKKKQ